MFLETIFFYVSIAPYICYDIANLGNKPHLYYIISTISYTSGSVVTVLFINRERYYIATVRIQIDFIFWGVTQGKLEKKNTSPKKKFGKSKVRQTQ